MSGSRSDWQVDEVATEHLSYTEKNPLNGETTWKTFKPAQPYSKLGRPTIGNSECVYYVTISDSEVMLPTRGEQQNLSYERSQGRGAVSSHFTLSLIISANNCDNRLSSARSTRHWRSWDKPWTSVYAIIQTSMDKHYTLRDREGSVLV